MSIVKLLIVLALVNFSLAAVCPVYKCGTADMETSGSCLKPTGTFPDYTTLEFKPCPALTAVAGVAVVAGTSNECVQTSQMVGTCTSRPRVGYSMTEHGEECMINTDCRSSSCVSLKCVAVAVGQTCKSNMACAEGNYCMGYTMATSGTCTVLPTLNAACTTMCAKGHFCRSTTKKCTAFLAEGVACTGASDCGMDLFCKFQEGMAFPMCAKFGAFGAVCSASDTVFCNRMRGGACSNGKCIGPGTEPVGTLVMNASYCQSMSAEKTAAGGMVCVQYTLTSEKECAAPDATCNYTYTDELKATITRTMACVCQKNAAPKSMCPLDSFDPIAIKTREMALKTMEEALERLRKGDTSGAMMAERPENAAKRLSQLMESSEGVLYSTADACVLDILVPLSSAAGRITFGAILFVAAFIGMLFA